MTAEGEHRQGDERLGDLNPPLHSIDETDETMPLAAPAALRTTCRTDISRPSTSPTPAAGQLHAPRVERAEHPSKLARCLIMALKLIYLVMTRIFAWARLAVQDSTAKNIEMLILRHELAPHRSMLQ
ncbi:hypothetical protein [Saccharopolyspora elongata]|uniref:Uncharacterized protein n=1 Tax=Saccharopolyspora elongata TaxID=2530387 RepID=A0A4R4XSA2_9PSEU|nr:hypothetical protein [Saccharopolyspora elongata]TDD34358.1 hypothetical protein E1288_44560 [Saccharopolyspora elongata]